MLTKFGEKVLCSLETIKTKEENHQQKYEAIKSRLSVLQTRYDVENQKLDEFKKMKEWLAKNNNFMFMFNIF